MKISTLAKWLIGCCASHVVLATCTAQQLGFPKGRISYLAQVDQSTQQWYTNVLRVLDEPPLLRMSGNHAVDCYRFLWLRTFHHPIAIRLDVRPDGTGLLVVKVASGASGFHSGPLQENRTTVIGREKIADFRACLREANFWKLDEISKISGADGAEWIVEGVRGGKHHAVRRWSPQKGPVRALGLFFVRNLANMPLSKDEIY